MSSTHSESDLPEHSFTEPQRRTLRIVNETTPLSDLVRSEATLPLRNLRTFWKNEEPLPVSPELRLCASRRLTCQSISESINESEYSLVIESYEEAQVSRAQSITIPERVVEHSTSVGYS
jgi:hypothetical protein